ncbi:MAG TPA: OB-fold nucleic acid binding domain-containing protein, partial [Thermodesulfobacteriota bacterium]|nr:OB-fold nucleic acid binding domain-containing protein [Thermodesulfobacteriota bacterium]
FCTRVDLRKVNRRVIESLIKCGTFDFTGAKRSQLMASLDRIMDISQAVQKDKVNGQISIFGTALGTDLKSVPMLPQMEEWHEAQLLSYEKEALGFYITGHPLEKYAKDLEYLTNADTEGVKEKQDDEEVIIGGIVTAVKEINTKKGDRMAFITLEDLKGFVEVVMFSDVYKNAASYFSGDAPVLVKGKVDKGGEHVKIIANSVYPVAQAKTMFANVVHIKADASRLETGSLEKVKGILSAHSGNSPVYFHLLWPDRDVVIAIPEKLKVAPSEKFVKDIETLLGDGSINIVQGGVA